MRQPACGCAKCRPPGKTGARRGDTNAGMRLILRCQHGDAKAVLGLNTGPLRPCEGTLTDGYQGASGYLSPGRTLDSHSLRGNS